MTTPGGGDVGIVVTAQDRASRVFQQVSRNAQQLSGRVLTMSTAMRGLNSATGQLVGSFLPLATGFGAAGLAIGGLTVALNSGIQRFRQMRQETRENALANERLQTNLLRAGFSYQNASGAVQDLRANLDRLTFQALPGLNLELQGFIAGLDTQSLDQFNTYVKILTRSGVEQEEAMRAVTEAMQGNFTLINQFLQPQTGEFISTQEEFAAAMRRLGVQVAASTNEAIAALQRLAEGAITPQQAAEQIRRAFEKDFLGTSEAVRENMDLVMLVLSQLTEEERQMLADHLEVFANRIPGSLVTYAGRWRDTLNTLAGTIRTGIGDLDQYEQAVLMDADKMIAHWQKIDPAVAEELRKLKTQYENGQISLTQYEMGVERILKEAAANYPQYADVAEEQLGRVRGYLRAVEEAARDAAQAQRDLNTLTKTPTIRPGESPRLPTPLPEPRLDPFSERPTMPIIGGKPVPIGGFQHGGRLTGIGMVGESGPEIARHSPLGTDIFPLSQGRGGGGIVHHIHLHFNGHEAADFILETLGDQIALGNPIWAGVTSAPIHEKKVTEMPSIKVQLSHKELQILREAAEASKVTPQALARAGVMGFINSWRTGDFERGCEEAEEELLALMNESQNGGDQS